jgi:hypothetical protein
MSTTSMFVVSYDLLAPGRDYQKLYEALRAVRAERVLESVWMLKGTYTAVQLREHFTQFIDANDRLLVAQVGDWAGWRLRIDPNRLA